MKANRFLVRLLLIVSIALATAGRAAESRRAFPEQEFQRRFDDWKALTGDAERLSRAESALFPRGVSSAQVKRMALTITNEDSRIEFVAAAYRHTVDPENFYDVYDAFQTFSKVFRLHDRLATQRERALPRGPGGVVYPRQGPAPLTDKEFADILASINKESFDNSKLALAKVAGTGARGRISSRQVLEMLKVFSFDDRKLECAKLAIDWVIDPADFHVVYAAFTFDNTKNQLSQFLSARGNFSSGSNRP